MYLHCYVLFKIGFELIGLTKKCAPMLHRADFETPTQCALHCDKHGMPKFNFLRAKHCTTPVSCDCTCSESQCQEDHTNAYDIYKVIKAKPGRIMLTLD